MNQRKQKMFAYILPTPLRSVERAGVDLERGAPPLFSIVFLDPRLASVVLLWITKLDNAQLT